MGAHENSGWYLLRVEAVNLSSFIYDTDDLSTVRGGGLLCLDAPHAVGGGTAGAASSEVMTAVAPPFDRWPDPKSVEQVTRGASNAVFRFRAASSSQAIETRSAVARHLRSHPTLRHATFVVDVVAQSEAYGDDREALLALNRFRQIRQPSLPVPDRNEATDDALPLANERNEDRSDPPYCGIDGKRPVAATEHAAQHRKRRLGAAAKLRVGLGKGEKHDLYHRLAEPLETCGGFRPTWDFEELTKRGDDRTAGDVDALGARDPYAHLAGKMAVIYADGNKFGAIQTSHCTTREAQIEFDQYVRQRRRQLLTRVRQVVIDDPAWQVVIREHETMAIRHRIETLLWGGDELVWVVPAWRGWTTARLLFEIGSNWKFGTESLTHAIGLVVCSHKAPIRGIVKLARDLAEIGKSRHRDRDTLTYQVLESFDSFAGQDAEKVRARLVPPGVTSEHLVFATSEAKSGGILHLLDEFQRCLQRLRGDHSDENAYPRRKLFEFIRAQRHPDATTRTQRMMEVVTRQRRRAGDPPPIVWPSSLQHMAPAQFLHLLEWWDYMPRGTDAKASPSDLLGVIQGAGGGTIHA